MTFRAIHARLSTRFGAFTAVDGIIDRYWLSSRNVTGALLCTRCEPIANAYRRYGDSSDRTYEANSTLRFALATGVALVFGGFGYRYRYVISGQQRDGHNISVHCKSTGDGNGTLQAGHRRPDLPDYRLNDITQHQTPEKRVWVTFGNGVYDITEFMVGHPGGNKIKLAAGGALEPFWDLYAVHRSQHVYTILESLRIGNVHPDDLASVGTSSGHDHFSHEPRRHPALRVHTSRPFNAETPAELLVEQFLTPNDLFYVRNHLPVPESAVAAAMAHDKSSAAAVGVKVSGAGLRRPVSLSVADLRRRFTPHTVTTTLQCAGNRRSHMKAEDGRAVRGTPWDIGAVGTARWTGVLLRDVLDWAGACEDKVGHVLFQGRDSDHEGMPYEASIPASVAFDPRRDVLLAYEMNGKELPVDHGYPLRVIVPGMVGARQVKWLKRIILSDEESQSFWQQQDYKTVNPSTTWDNLDVTQLLPIYEYPVQAAICSPVNDATVQASEESITVRGYAMSGGGRGILRVDVTADGGKTWHGATLQREPQPVGRQWAWTLWEVTVPLPTRTAGKSFEVAVKATDTSQNTQPESDIGIWNLRGLVENRWHRILVNVVKPT